MSVTGRITLAGLVAVLLVLGAVEISPWPSALLIRWAFDGSGVWTNARLAPLIPAGITMHPDEIYDPLDPELTTIEPVRRNFRANRSMRDVEAGVECQVKELYRWGTKNA